MKKRYWIWVGVVASVVMLATSCRLYVFKRLDPKQPLVDNLAPPEGLVSLTAESCGNCHNEIYAEWKTTQHASAWTDPLFQADWADLDKPYMCTYCHTPVGQQRPLIVKGLKDIDPVIAKGDKNPNFDPNLQQEGVTCVACHLREGKLRSPFPIEEAEAPHAVIYAPEQGTPETCRYCHYIEQRSFTKLKRPLIDTFNEWEEYKKKGGTKMCLECHMPEIERPTVLNGPVRKGRQHIFRGGHNKEFLRSEALEVKVSTATSTGETINGIFTVFNKTGHRFPTGEPARIAEFTMEALDRDGLVLATSPIQRVERVVDEHGFIETSDNTLSPHAETTFNFSVKAPGAVSVKFVVRYYLWDPNTKVAKDSGLSLDQLMTVMIEQLVTL
jgi:nitrate reductase cytochrome c-type subunit